MTDPTCPRSDREILIGAARALGRVDLLGFRGITLLSIENIEDMALALVVLGLVSIPPSQTEPPVRLVVPRLKEF